MFCLCIFGLYGAIQMLLLLLLFLVVVVVVVVVVHCIDADGGSSWMPGGGEAALWLAGA